VIISERTNARLSLFFMGACFSIAAVLFSSSWWPSIPYWLLWFVVGVCFFLVLMGKSPEISIVEMMSFLILGGVWGFTMISNSSQGAFQWKVTYPLLFIAVITTISTHLPQMVNSVRFEEDYHSVSMILGILCLTEVGIWIISGDYYWHFFFAICLALFIIIIPEFAGMKLKNNLPEIIIGAGLGCLLFREMHGFIDSHGAMTVTILILTAIGLAIAYTDSTDDLSCNNLAIDVDEE